MSLFSSLYVGTSGLQSSQEGLNVVAHNVTNTDTKGYVRQQVSYATREYNFLSKNITGVAQKQIGLGVYISEVRQVRDRFLDLAYREEAGRQGFYDVSYAAVEEVEGILGELHDATFSNAFKNLMYSIQEMAKDPSSEVNQGLFIQYSQNFVEASRNAYSDLCDYQDKLNFTVTQKVDRINQLGRTIYEMNNKIRAIEAGGIEHANDYRDARNQAMDELASICKIEYDTDVHGNVLVKVEGHDFVRPNEVNEMAYDADLRTGFYTCFWPDSAETEILPDGTKRYIASTAPVFDLTAEISALRDTDIGSLKATLLARGDHRANQWDLIDEDAYDKVSNSIMMNVMAEFDKLVHSVVTTINDVIASSADTKTGYLCQIQGYNENNRPIYVPLQIFQRIDCMDEYTYDPTNPNAWNGYIVTPEDPKDPATWFSINNLKVNKDLQQYPAHLGMIRPDESVDHVTMKNLLERINQKDFVLNPTLTNKISIAEYYTNFIGQISNSGNVFKKLKENQDLTVDSVEAARQGTIGVATDEELTNMIKFQNAYNASSRFINVIDECMEHVIMQLGS
ncbi:MAG: flagellar hook-associated protein FlgK [Lachnospiraceae bacterium]|nr:flagellar hook-associated protein FlgK [Lachnospiraceae bacterium]